MSSFFEAVKPPRKKAESEPLWLIAYLDLTTNLMALFVLMLSMSQMDVQKFDAVSKEINQNPTMNLEDLKKQIDAAIAEKKLQNVVETSIGLTGLKIEFLNGVLFQSGSSELSPFASLEATPILDILSNVDGKYMMSFEGHSDDTAIKNPKYPDNWALSSARGSALLSLMERKGVSKERMSVAGYADTRPKVPIQGKSGKDLDAARAANRRVVIRVSQ